VLALTLAFFLGAIVGLFVACLVATPEEVPLPAWRAVPTESVSASPHLLPTASDGRGSRCSSLSHSEA
jgi:hypothetical protein